jgi:GNAT superfamily N-acetyltransferase
MRVVDGMRVVEGVCHNPTMTLPRVVVRAAESTDHPFVTEMARHACVIEDRPLPKPDDDDVLEMLPAAGVVAIIAQDHHGTPVGAAWTYYSSPPLHCDAAGVPLPELCIAVAPGRRGAGIGGVLLDALFADLATDHDTLVANVHVRNPRHAPLRVQGVSRHRPRQWSARAGTGQRPR